MAHWCKKCEVAYRFYDYCPKCYAAYLDKTDVSSVQVERVVSHFQKGLKMNLDEVMHELNHTGYLCDESIYWLIEEVDRLKLRNDEWNKKFHERCEAQLDAFRKGGMVEAAMRCAEIVENVSVECVPIAKLIRNEFGLDGPI